MAKILCLVQHLQYGSATTQLLRLAAGLDRSVVQLQVAACRGDGPVAQELQRLQIPVANLSATRAWDLGGLVSLRRMLNREKPDLVHVWGLAALRRLHLAGVPKCPVMLSNPLPPSSQGKAVGFLNRWLMRRCHGLVVPDPFQADRCRAGGITGPKIEVLGPGVSDEFQIGDLPSIHSNSPVIACVGPLARHKGYYDAIWAFDMLRHWRSDLQLWIIGDGPDTPRLQRFAHSIGLGQAVKFWGECPDLRPFLQRAAAVWVPSRAASGRLALLEALAAGRPVIASQLPGLAELVAEGKTGFLIPPGEKVRFAKKTRLLIDEPGLGRELGAAGRQFVRDRHSSRQMVEQFAQLCKNLAA